MFPLIHSLLVPSCCICIAFCEASLGQETQPEVERMKKLFDSSLDEFNVKIGDQKAKPKIVFRYTNRPRGTAYGFSAMWADEAGRPVILGGVFPAGRNLIRHSLEYVSRDPGLVVQRDGRVVWKPTKDQVLRFKPVPGAATPAESKTRRRLQLKNLASEFSAEMLGFQAGDSDRQVLRLLTTPVHHYGQPDGDVIEGAIFLFVLGTDPECGLLLEAAKHKDQYRWEYALVRRTSGALQVTHKDKVVWQKPKGYASTRDPSKDHVTLTKELPAR